jgi:hypothetical protein
MFVVTDCRLILVIPETKTMLPSIPGVPLLGAISGYYIKGNVARDRCFYIVWCLLYTR